MNLPEYDYESIDSLQASAETRATAAMIAADAPYYFKGMALKLTVSVKSLFLMLMRQDGSEESGGDRMERDAVILLYLCTQDPKAWSEPVKQGKHLLQPLRARPLDWLAEIDRWADETLTPAELTEAAEAIDQLWATHHAPRVVLDSTEVGDSQKKTPILNGESDSPHPSSP